MKKFILIFILITTGCATVKPQSPDEAFATYIQFFNSMDANSIATHSWHTPARINDDSIYSSDTIRKLYLDLFSQLKSEDYDYSKIFSKKIILISKNQAVINITFQRIRKDGSTLHPIKQKANYMLVRNHEKWAIASMSIVK